MTASEKTKLLLLLSIKREFGDLNTGLVVLYRRVHGDMSKRALAAELNLDRSTITKALKKHS